MMEAGFNWGFGILPIAYFWPFVAGVGVFWYVAYRYIEKRRLRCAHCRHYHKGSLGFTVCANCGRNKDSRTVSELPRCDFCSAALSNEESDREPCQARFDAVTKHGGWAYMCAEHWETERACASASANLGASFGYELVERPKPCPHCGYRKNRIDYVFCRKCRGGTKFAIKES